MDRRVTPLKRVTSPTWGPPPPCKQAPSRTFVLSREKNYLQPFPGSQEVLKKGDSKLYLSACASWRKKGYADQQISRSALEVKEQRDGTAVRVLTSHQGARVQIPASMPYVG